MTLLTKKFAQTSKFRHFLKMFTCSIQLQLDIKNGKTIGKLVMKNISHADDVSDDVTEWRQNRPSIFMFKWNRHIFRDNSKTIQGMIIKLYV